MRRWMSFGLSGPFLLISLPLLLLQGAVSWFYYHEAENHLESEIRLEQSHHLQALAADVQSELDHAVDELLFLADQVRLHKALEYRDGREVLGEDFLSFLNTTRLFDQVRLLDDHGMEVVRANYNDGQPVLVPETKLQNKSKRYYFRQTRKLPAGSVYISRLDLNIENGQVEKPFKPMLRLATSVSAGNNDSHGVLILNYRADVILHRLRLPNQMSEVLLINSEGFSLRPGEERQSWEQFLSGDTTESLQQKVPRLWQMMEKQRAGALQLAGGDFYFFDRINAADYMGRPGRLTLPFHPEESWYLLIHLSSETVSRELAQVRSGIVGFNITGGAVILLLSLLAAYNIRRRRQAFAMVQTSERRLRSIYDQTPLGYLCLDEGGTICEMNDAAATIFGCPARELQGRNIEGFTGFRPDPQHPDEVRKQHEFELEQADGSRRWIEFRCKPVFDEKGRMRYHCLFSDISGRRQAEQTHLQLARLQATETLAGGVAHLINNYMAVISGNIDLLIFHLGGDQRQRERLERIRITAYKTSDIANDMLNYSRRGALPFGYCRPTAILHEAVDSRLQEDHRISLSIEGRLHPIQGDAPRLHQVLRTLLDNAVEAIDSEGHIRVSGRNRRIDTHQANRLAGMQPGDYVEIQVSDDGCGLASDVREHLFEPFFSTKFQGRGLSLAAAYGIIKMHGGYLYVESTPGEGSEFSIYLPEAGIEPEDAEPRATRRPPESASADR